MVWNRTHVEAMAPDPAAWREWSDAAVPDGLSARLLSIDPGDGAFTAEVRVPRGWSLPSAWSLAPSVDAFVLDGRLRVGDVELERWDFTYRPAGYVNGAVEAVADTVMVVFVQGPAEVTLHDGPEPDRRPAAHDGVVVRLPALSVPPKKPLTGRVSTFTSRTLRMDAHTGERIFITGSQGCSAPAELDAVAAQVSGRIEWHECVEEIYQVGSWVSMDDPADQLVLEQGSYCFRPPGVPHGPFRMGPSEELQSLFRISSELTNNYVSVDAARRLWTDYPAESLDATVRERITSDQVFSTVTD